MPPVSQPMPAMFRLHEQRPTIRWMVLRCVLNSVSRRQNRGHDRLTDESYRLGPVDTIEQILCHSRPDVLHERNRSLWLFKLLERVGMAARYSNHRSAWVIGAIKADKVNSCCYPDAQRRAFRCRRGRSEAISSCHDEAHLEPPVCRQYWADGPLAPRPICNIAGPILKGNLQRELW